MSIRDNPTYLTMTPIRMVEIIEMDPCPTQEEQEAAWQWCADTGIWKHLQGFYGRSLEGLINMGFIEKPLTKKEL